MLVNLTYCQDVDIPNQGNNLNHVFRLNSIFAPDYGTGPAPLPGPHHQPRGHDQWQKMYTKYCVVGATVKVQPFYAGPGADGVDTACTFYGHLDDSPVAVNYSVPEIIELGMGGKSKYLTMGFPDRAVSANSRSANPSLYWKVGMKKFFGLSKRTQVIFPAAPALGNDLPLGLGEPGKMCATFGTNPLNGCFLKLMCDDVNQTANTPTIKARVTIRYTTVLYDALELPTS